MPDPSPPAPPPPSPTSSPRSPTSRPQVAPRILAGASAGSPQRAPHLPPRPRRLPHIRRPPAPEGLPRLVEEGARPPPWSSTCSTDRVTSQRSSSVSTLSTTPASPPAPSGRRRCSTSAMRPRAHRFACSVNFQSDLPLPCSSLDCHRRRVLMLHRLRSGVQGHRGKHEGYFGWITNSKLRRFPHPPRQQRRIPAHGLTPEIQGELCFPHPRRA